MIMREKQFQQSRQSKNSIFMIVTRYGKFKCHDMVDLKMV